MGRILRAFVDHSDLVLGNELLLSERESHHLFRVLRIPKETPIELLDGKGRIFQAICTEVAKSRVRVRVSSLAEHAPARVRLRVSVALGKRNKWEELIRPLTELGANRLTPLLTERSEGRISDSKLASKLDKWSRLVQEACKQSGNAWMPEIDPPRNLASLFDKNADLWMCSLKIGTGSFAADLNAREWNLLIGPEGGWTAEEEDYVQEMGGKPFSLGSGTLRLETAAISALAVARQRLLC